jgi:hypothetical protein
MKSSGRDQPDPSTAHRRWVILAAAALVLVVVLVGTLLLQSPRSGPPPATAVSEVAVTESSGTATRPVAGAAAPREVVSGTLAMSAAPSVGQRTTLSVETLSDEALGSVDVVVRLPLDYTVVETVPPARSVAPFAYEGDAAPSAIEVTWPATMSAGAPFKSSVTVVPGQATDESSAISAHMVRTEGDYAGTVIWGDEVWSIVGGAGTPGTLLAAAPTPALDSGPGSAGPRYGFDDLGEFHTPPHQPVAGADPIVADLWIGTAAAPDPGLPVRWALWNASDQPQHYFGKLRFPAGWHATLDPGAADGARLMADSGDGMVLFEATLPPNATTVLSGRVVPSTAPGDWVTQLYVNVEDIQNTNEWHDVLLEQAGEVGEDGTVRQAYRKQRVALSPPVPDYPSGDPRCSAVPCPTATPEPTPVGHPRCDPYAPCIPEPTCRLGQPCWPQSTPRDG